MLRGTRLPLVSALRSFLLHDIFLIEYALGRSPRRHRPYVADARRSSFAHLYSLSTSDVNGGRGDADYRLLAVRRPVSGGSPVFRRGHESSYSEIFRGSPNAAWRARSSWSLAGSGRTTPSPGASCARWLMRAWRSAAIRLTTPFINTLAPAENSPRVLRVDAHAREGIGARGGRSLRCRAAAPLPNSKRSFAGSLSLIILHAASRDSSRPRPTRSTHRYCDKNGRTRQPSFARSRRSSPDARTLSSPTPSSGSATVWVGASRWRRVRGAVIAGPSKKKSRALMWVRCGNLDEVLLIVLDE